MASSENENSQLYSRSHSHSQEDNNNNDKNYQNSKSSKESNESKDIINNSPSKKNKEEMEVELVLKNNENEKNENQNKNSSKNNSSNEHEQEQDKNIEQHEDKDKEKDKTNNNNNNELTLPKIEINCSLKQVQENNMNIIDKIIDNNKLIKETSSNNDSTNSNNTKANEEKLKEKEEKLESTFNKLKNALIQTCMEIEENLNRIYYPEKTEEMMNVSHVNCTKTSKFTKNNTNFNLTEEQKQKEKEYFQKIQKYKSKIKSANKEINLVVSMNKIDELERIYEEKKSILEKIKVENNALKNVKVIQEKDNILINNSSTKKKELIHMNEKIKKLKEETKIKKDYYRTVVEKIKSQNEKINELEKKCDLINQNMNYYKKKQIKELKKQKEEALYNDNNKEEEHIDINTLKKNYEEKYSKLKEKEENLTPKVKEQNKIIKTLLKYNENLSQKVKDVMSEINDNMTQIMTFENNIKRKEIQIYDSLSKKNNSLLERKPFHIAPITSNYQKKKIFDYKKYLKEYEEGLLKNKNRLYTSAETYIKPKTLNEIEKLKTDIQQAIKKSELDDKIKKIIIGIKQGNNGNNGSNNNNEEEDALQKFLKRNEDINFSDRYNFYVTEGANLPVPIKVENINKNINSNY